MKRLCTVISCALMAAMLGILCLPCTIAMAAFSPVLDSIAFTTAVPEPGAAADTAVTFTPSSKAEVKESVWYDGDGGALAPGAVFEKGHVYRLRLVFVAAAGCSFAENFSRLNVTVNGEIPETALTPIGDYYGTEAFIVWMDYECEMEALPTVLKVDGYAPLAPGMTLPGVANFCSGSPVRVTKAVWYKENGTSGTQVTGGAQVSEGALYYARLTLEPEAGYYFDTELLDGNQYTVLINGSDTLVELKTPTIAYQRAKNSLTVDLQALKATEGTLTLAKTYSVLRSPWEEAASLGVAGPDTPVLGDGFGNWRPVNFQGVPGWVDLSAPQETGVLPDEPETLLLLSGTGTEEGAVLTWNTVPNTIGWLHRTITGFDDVKYPVSALNSSYTDNTLGAGETATYYLELTFLKDGSVLTSAPVTVTRKAPAFERTTPTLLLTAPETLSVGETAQVLVSGSDGKTTFISKDSAIAKISSDGVLTALRPGQVQITVKTAQSDRYTAAQVSFTLQVLPAAVPVEAENTKGGVRLTWDPVEEAKAYTVWRCAAGGDWSEAAVTEASEWTDNGVEAGERLCYRVCVRYGTEPEPRGTGKTAEIVYLPPVTAEAANDDGVILSWGKVPGADAYQVWRSVNGGAYTKVKSLTGTSWTDTAAEEGTSCSYKVRAYVKGDDGSLTYSAFGAPVSISFLRMTAVKTENAASGILLSWAKAKGADAYQVWRSVGGSSYAEVKSLAGTSWTDTAAEEGTACSYKVRAYVKGGDGSLTYSAFGAPVSISFLRMTAVKAENAASGITLSWAKAEGAYAYQIWRSVDGGAYTKVKSLTGTSWTDTAAEEGTACSYKIRAYVKGKDGGLTYSAFKKAEIVRLAMTGVEAANSADGIRLQWSKAKGAHAYQIWRSANGGSFTKVKSLTGTSWVDEGVLSGTEYTYKVRAYEKTDPIVYSAFGSPVSCRHVGCPTLTVSASSGSIAVKWTKVGEAKGYQIFRRTPGGTWAKVKTSSGTGWTDTDVKKGTVYEYRLRCYIKDDAVTYSAWSAVKEAKAK